MRQQFSESRRRLYRSRKDSKIAGVCGGLGDFFDLDSTWVRLVFLLFLILGGSALIAYIVFWIIVPLEPMD